MYFIFYFFIVEIRDSDRVSISVCVFADVTQMRLSQTVLLLLCLALSQVVRSSNLHRHDESTRGWELGVGVGAWRWGHAFRRLRVRVV